MAGREAKRTASARNKTRAQRSPSLDLFGDETLPDGFRYQPDFLSQEEESFLLRNLKGLPFMEFEFQGFKGKRRVVCTGPQGEFECRFVQ